MDSRLFETKLVNHKIFKDIRESLKDDNDKKSRNLFELKDDVLYVWNSLENCLFSVNLKHLEDHVEETPYQKLHLVSPPAFDVERIITSECGSRLCVWGTRGVTVADLPPRWGRGGLFDSGSQTVLCKSSSLDERFLYSQCEIHKVHWHPKSLSHLLVLMSDNTMRLYNIALKTGPKLVKIFTIGPKPTGSLGQTVLDSLGDMAVDFIPTPDSDHLLILSGNGDVYMMQCDLDNKNNLQANLKGPLPMYPPADDNYGSESCSIIALGGTDIPTLVVIASASAELYHCLLLPSASESSEVSHALYVIESVELNIVLNTDENALRYVYPINLYPINRNTYACSHTGGVHSVTVPALDRLAEYAMADESDAESAQQAAAACAAAARARHLVRTARAPAACALALAPPRRALLLLCGGALVLRSLEPWNLEEEFFKEIQLKNPSLDQDDINNLLKEKQKLSFTTIIQEVLDKKMSQPILKLEKKEEPSPQECLELLTQSTVKLRSEYMQRQQQAAELVQRKLLALQALDKQQRSWIADLQKEINVVKQQSENLKQKKLLAEKYQDDLKNRCVSCARALRTGASSAEERRALAELRRAHGEARAAAGALAALRAHAGRKSDEIKKRQEEYKKKDTVLGKSHSDTISSILQQQTAQISTLIEETKLLKDQLGVV